MTKKPPIASIADRRRAGRQTRAKVPRTSHAVWKAPADRPDPVTLLEEQCRKRLQRLVPIRHGRMLSSPFAFYRGAAVVMAEDLAHTPTTGIRVQACGDAHLVNFGLFATPERRLVFDVNDFDETLPGPWEWDLKRLTASLVVVARGSAFAPADQRDVAVDTTSAYRQAMARYAAMPTLDVWYSEVDVERYLDMALQAGERQRVERAMARARHHTDLTALPKLTELIDGKRQLMEAPPLLTHKEADRVEDRILSMFKAYRRTLLDDRRHLLERYHYLDTALKVVGVGSVGTRCFVMLFDAGDGDGEDPLFLQVKQAEVSVLSRHLPKSPFRSHGERVVNGQRLMQAASDIFLGWTHEPVTNTDYYFRHLRDMKGTVLVDTLPLDGLHFYGRACGWALARAHARSGDAVRLAAYMGSGGVFDGAIGDFSVAYADQTEKDYATFAEAVKKGRIKAETGV